MFRSMALVGALVAGAWSTPVDGPVVRRFEAPASAFGPGHRGVDFGAPPGTAVRSAGSGVVAFAGPVGGRLVVVVAHPGGQRSGYAYLARLVVTGGQPVERGAVLGFSGGTGPGHPAGVLHFSLREGGEYVDPLRRLGLEGGSIHPSSASPRSAGHPAPRFARPRKEYRVGGYTE
jgi:murein DD-endopeptidase MepM/ murein hydrolase activator NlpD